tara:strand:- start:15897 stop:16121 length:225 start_codon:yes stop_codon:yes gene_type:complete
MSSMMMVVQDALFLIAVAASVNVQLARASRLAGAADTSAPALRRKEVSCMATISKFLMNLKCLERKRSIAQSIE